MLKFDKHPYEKKMADDRSTFWNPGNTIVRSILFYYYSIDGWYYKWRLKPVFNIISTLIAHHCVNVIRKLEKTPSLIKDRPWINVNTRRWINVKYQRRIKYQKSNINIDIMSMLTIAIASSLKQCRCACWDYCALLLIFISDIWLKL